MSEHPGQPHKPPLSLALLIAICDRGKGAKIAELYATHDAKINFLSLGKGTANSKILNYLGLGQTEKTILFSVLPTREAMDVLSQVDWALDIGKPGHGIAFIVPLENACWKNEVKSLAGLNGLLDYGTPKIEEDKDEEGENVGFKFDYELVLVVANRGYNQEVMDAAQAAGARGGTIINAKGFAAGGAEKFFGVSIQPEKEIILILTSGDTREAVMLSISEHAGAGTQPEAVTFSVPVLDVVGLQSSSHADETEKAAEKKG
ncbi:nitrogen regulatory protein P-II [Synergistales bacterium]|nr:nitrogen regulatory protein P-II [Synergistales bacterium]